MASIAYMHQMASIGQIGDGITFCQPVLGQRQDTYAQNGVVHSSKII